MAIQQYDYTACCTGFLQQLPSFWGIRQNRRGRAVLAKWCTVTNGAGSSKAGGVGGCRGRGGGGSGENVGPTSQGLCLVFTI